MNKIKKKKSPSGIFITGTDTGVGKTVIASALATYMNSCGHKVSVMKPIETGCFIRSNILVPSDGMKLKYAAGSNDLLSNIAPVRFKNPLAPMPAAKLEKKPVDIKRIEQCFHSLQRESDFIIVEGLGGILVPISKGYSVRDLIKKLELPLLIVARPVLGTLNHILLTVEAARKEKIEVKAIVLSGFNNKTKNIAERTNPDVLKELLPDIPLFLFPKIERINSSQIRKEAGDVLSPLADLLIK